MRIPKNMWQRRGSEKIRGAPREYHPVDTKEFFLDDDRDEDFPTPEWNDVESWDYGHNNEHRKEID